MHAEDLQARDLLGLLDINFIVNVRPGWKFSLHCEVMKFPVIAKICPYVPNVLHPLPLGDRKLDSQ